MLRRLWRLALATALLGVAAIAAPAAAEPVPSGPVPLPSNSSISFAAGRQVGYGWPASGAIPVGDWDHNGHEDVMLVAADATLLFYPATGPERYTGPFKIGQGWGAALELQSVDWDSDGDADLIARFSDGRLIAYYGNGRGGFKKTVQIGRGWHGMRTWAPVQRSAAGHPAIISTSFEGRLSVYPTEGKGRFLTPHHLGYGWASLPHIVGAGDWDKNGRSDLLVVDEHARLRLYSASQSGTSFAVSQIGYGWGAFTRLASVRDTARGTSILAQTADGKLFAYRGSYRGSSQNWLGAPMGESVLGTVPWSASGTRSVVPGSASGSGNGVRLSYQVEVEAGLPADARVFANHVHAILNDDRGWRRSFDRVSSGGSMRVVLASPAFVERLCPGLDTRGYTSCRYGNNVVINMARWAGSTLPFERAGGSLDVYRDYVINHESGHYLGNGHVTCPGAGRLAPVMQQQTHGVLPCAPNGWPHP